MEKQSQFDTMHLYDDKQMLREPGAKFTGNPYDPQQKVMPEFAQRMSVELQELVRRLQKLEGYTATKSFTELDPLNRELLQRQRDEMLEYAKTLSLRYTVALLTYG